MGYDFGIKPRVMVMEDIEFPGLLTDAGFTALGYLELPYFGVLANPALLVMLFEDNELGQKCFSRIRSWITEGDDGDAVGISFIEFNSGEYGMCIYPEENYLVKRIIPEHLISEIDTVIVSTGYLKMFPEQSEHYSWFRSKAELSPIVLAQGSIDQGPMLEDAFRKRKVKFYKEDEIPPQSIEAVLSSSQTDTTIEKINLSKEEPEIMSPSETFLRREEQLRRFFPVTVERFKTFPDFEEPFDVLSGEGYRNWQIIQAGCNLAFKYQYRDMFESTQEEANGDDYQNRSIMNTLDILVQGFEDVTKGLPPTNTFSLDSLRDQIQADSKLLYEHFSRSDSQPEESDIIQQELATLGLLDETS